MAPRRRASGAKARRPPVRTSRRPAPEPPRAEVRPSTRLAALPEAPHTHLVCRSCARIVEVPMEFDEQQALENLLLRAPAGWSLDSITVSMTGVCARCGQGPSD